VLEDAGSNGRRRRRWQLTFAALPVIPRFLGGLFEDADLPELLVAGAQQLIRGLALQLPEVVAERLAERGRRLFPVSVGPAHGLGHDAVDDAQPLEIGGGKPEELGGLRGLGGVPTEWGIRRKKSR